MMNAEFRPSGSSIPSFSWSEVQYPLLVAHRGLSSEAPENTLPAFLAAVHLGCHFIELDYVHSADGVSVVFHDLLLDRTTDAATRWGATPHGTPIAWKTWSELQQLDAGAWFAPQFQGTRLSSLAEVLQRTPQHVGIMIERKAGDAETLVDVLTQQHAQSRVIVQAFDAHFLAELRRLAPTLTLGLLGHGPLTTEALDVAQALRAAVIGWEQEPLLADDIRVIHARGLQAWAWTVDEPDRADELLSAGLDGLITNQARRMLPLVMAHRARRAS